MPSEAFHTGFMTAAADLDPELEPTKSVDDTARILGISRQSAYAGVHDGTIPSIRIRGRILVPTAGLRRLLMLDGAA